MPAREKEKRRYGGQSFEDRAAERRERLVRATAIVAGRFGLEGTSVAAICAEAGLTQRYFYEAFPNREAIFIEAYRAVRDELLARIGDHAGTADPTRAALFAFYTALAANPGMARVFLVDLDDHGPAMKAVSRQGAEGLIKTFGLRAREPLVLAGMLGAIVDIAKRWIESGFAEKAQKVVEIALAFTKVKG
ncbi:MAG TPA: TetR/AcrR family transcriptional regulator [Rhizomicrobium sp.]|jgi:AcrR family transcriptional regulator